MALSRTMRGPLDELERIACGSSWVHALDPRAKVIATGFFLVTVASFDRYTVLALLPLFAYPLFLCIAGQVPLLQVVRRLVLVVPFMLTIAAMNPLFDTDIRLRQGGLGISGGWLSCASMIVRFLLSTAAVIAMVAVTGMNALCAAAERLGASRLFVTQLAFLFRYLFVLTDEATRMSRAVELRSPGGRKLALSQYGSLVGQLLLRTLDRATRIQRAMVSRGFNGQIPLLRPLTLRARDVVFVLVWTTLFAGVRLFGLAESLGRFTLGAYG